jgi:hypothetical protein
MTFDHLFKVWAFLFVLTWPLGSEAFELFGEPPQFEVRLYTGVPDVAYLGETIKEVNQRKKYPFQKISLESDTLLKAAGVTEGLSFDFISARVFFKRNAVALIILNPPFKGLIRSKEMTFYVTEKSTQMTWEQFVVRKFGEPDAKKYGGRLIGDVFYYTWGDIQLAPLGISKIALYQDNAIRKYRQNSTLNPDDFLFK